jgi:hypothetical protein
VLGLRLGILVHLNPNPNPNPNPNSNPKPIQVLTDFDCLLSLLRELISSRKQLKSIDSNVIVEDLKPDPNFELYNNDDYDNYNATTDEKGPNPSPLLPNEKIKQTSSSSPMNETLRLHKRSKVIMEDLCILV